MPSIPTRLAPPSLLAAGLLLWAGAGCAEPEDPAGVRFVDVSRAAGLDFVHDHCGTGRRFLVETNSSGLGWLDYDGDGRLDLYLNQAAPIEPGSTAVPPPNRLFRNLGDGTFEDVTERAGVGDTGVGMGVACADYDGDGHADLYVCNFGPNRLYRNRGDGTFEDVTEAAGAGEAMWTSGCCFADLDRDGDLDLFLANYVDLVPEEKKRCGQHIEGRWIDMYCHPDNYPGLPDTLLRNEGDGTFTDVSDASGLRDVDFATSGKALGVSPCDFDDDGDLDLFVANDAAPNYFFLNLGDLRFEEAALQSGLAYNGDGETESCMGTDWADIDLDGDFDLVTCNIQYQSNTCWENLGDGLFDDVTYQLGLGEKSFLLVGFSLDFFDYDLDGDPDLFVANGGMIDNISSFDPSQTFEQPDHLYENLGPGSGFRLVEGSGDDCWSALRVGRAAAVADFDNDGDGDIALSNMAGPAILLRNDGGNRSSWIGFDLEGAGLNRDAIGARVRVEAGGLSQVEEVRGAVGIGSFGDLRLQFGLGEAERVDRVEIRWPTGRVQVLEGLEVRRYHALREPGS